MSGHEPSPLIPIEKKKFLCVEYPGYVKRAERAIKTLGGESALSEALSNNDQVQLRYRAKDIFSHPINGDFMDTCKLLVKVTRRVKRNKKTGEIVEDSAPWKPQILGTVEKTVRFRALADFQYIVPKDDKMRQLKEALDVGDVSTIMNYKVPDDDEDFNNLRNIPPPAFTPIETPFSYGYKQNAPVLRVRVRQPDGSFKIKLLNRSKGHVHQVTGIMYEDENIPSKSWHNLREPATELEREAIEAVAELFEDRPIWSRFALRHNLDDKFHKNLTNALAHSAYTFHNGPWRDCWVKYGLDPRKDQQYHIYQQVDIRRIIKEGQQRRVISRRANSTAFRNLSTTKKEVLELVPNQHIFDGKIIPGPSSMFQLCDIIDPEITVLIRNKEYIKSHSTKYAGFFYRCVFERIRKNLKKKYEELKDTGKVTPIKNIEYGLADEINKEIAAENENTLEEEHYEVEEEDVGGLASAGFEKAAMDAMNAMNNSESSSRRLQEVADEYIDQLESVNTTLTNDLEDEGDIDLDMLDTLEEFDDEELDGMDDDEVDSQQEQDAINQDIEMKD